MKLEHEAALSLYGVCKLVFTVRRDKGPNGKASAQVMGGVRVTFLVKDL